MIGPGDSLETSYHVHTHPSKVEHWRHLIEIIALISAAAWAFYVFVYQERIKPAGQPVYVESALKVDHQLQRSSVEFVSVAVDFHSIASSQADLAGVAINVYGWRFLTRTRHHVFLHPRTSGFTEVYNSLETSNPVMLASFSHLWRPFGGGQILRLDANGNGSVSLWFGVRRGQYDALTVGYTYCFVRTGDQRVYPIKLFHRSDGTLTFPSGIENNVPDNRLGYRCVRAAGTAQNGFPL
jgi:hypothetical protein